MAIRHAVPAESIYGLFIKICFKFNNAYGGFKAWAGDMVFISDKMAVCRIKPLKTLRLGER